MKPAAALVLVYPSCSISSMLNGPQKDLALKALQRWWAHLDETRRSLLPPGDKGIIEHQNEIDECMAAIRNLPTT